MNYRSEAGSLYTQIIGGEWLCFPRHFLQYLILNSKIIKKILGSSALNPGAVFLRFFTVAFLLFLTLQGQLSNPAGQ